MFHLSHAGAKFSTKMQASNDNIGRQYDLQTFLPCSKAQTNLVGSPVIILEVHACGLNNKSQNNAAQ